MTLINLKFSPEMETLIMQGKKICTTRDEQKGRWVKDEPVRHMEITIDTQTALDIMLLKLALAEMNSSEIPNSSSDEPLSNP